MSELYNLPIEKMKNRKAISRIGWALVALMLFSQIGAVIVMIICKLFFKSFTETSVYNFIISTLPIYFIAFPIFFLIIRKVPKKDIAIKSKLTAIEFMKILIISFGALYIFNFLGTGINFIISVLKGSPVVNPLADLLGKVNVFETLIFVGILAPIMEEIIFRKVFLSRLLKFGDFFGIFLSALAFGMFHGNLSQFFYAVALGCIFAYTVVKTGTIKYSIILHISVNIFGSVITPQIALTNNIILTSLIGIFVITVVTASIILSINDRKNIVLENNNFYLTKKEQFGIMFENSGMIVYTILFILIVISVITAM